MNIPWRLKSGIFRAIDVTNAWPVLYFLQNHVTKRGWTAVDRVDALWETQRRHLAALERPRVLEFGAGKYLGQNLYLSAFVGSQVVVDLFPQLACDQADAAARALVKLEPRLKYTPIRSAQDLAAYNIDYVAPCDVAASPFPDGAFDACISTSTLEHIPRADIERILKALRRIVRTGGLVSMTIDYSDHYAHTDRSIGKANFLQYTEAQWRGHNHRTHYQNRLRHQDYLKMFTDAGLEVVHAQATDPAPPPPRFAPPFDPSHPDTLSTKGVFLLRNGPPAI